jgi:glycosidase
MKLVFIFFVECYNNCDWSDIMSKNTKKELRNCFIYQVYSRNHNESGTFKEFQNDLDRIKDMGVDIVYLLPIHKIGQKQKKGNLGCPYSIQDYRSINPEYGTLEDFKDLIQSVHQKGMKLMIDVVYNHTSYDSVLLEEHPEYFYKNEKGEFANRVGDWWDITDFDYTADKGLWDELIDTVVYWTKLGVDGFRWDVASLLPYEFLKQAHDAVLAVNPESIFVSESVHGGFLRYLRSLGFGALSESEIYEIFDMAYDYDVHPYFEGYLKGEVPFKRYLEELVKQDEIYPDNYVKMRNLENHDFGRFAPMVNNDPDLIANWTAQVFFSKGSTMVYAGQEVCDNNKPDLFDIDKVNWDGNDISPLITKLAKIVKDPIFAFGYYEIKVIEQEVFYGSYTFEGKKIVGIFNVGKEKGELVVDCPDGEYVNLINNQKINVSSGKLTLMNEPIIFWEK